MTTALLWFRRDLRLRDNPALVHALAYADQVIPVYIHAPDEEAPWPTGAASRWWLQESLKALDQDLRQHGSQLQFFTGPSHTTLLRLAKSTGASSVYWNRLYEPHALLRDKKVMAALANAGLTSADFPGALWQEPWALRNRSDQPYQIFTPFWKTLRGLASPATPLQRPRGLKPPGRWPQALPLNELGLLTPQPWMQNLASCWQPGEAGAQLRLRNFLGSALPDYIKGRDLPATEGVSSLSPFLHFGEISVGQLWHRLQALVDRQPRHARAVEAYLRQLAWRDFAHYVLYHWPHTSHRALRSGFDNFPWRPARGLLKAWQKGRTGYPLVDAGMRQLWHSGWMHNRVRMLVASFLSKNCLIPWQTGARWFWDTLVDADLANNSFGWQWTAGCGADAAPFFRIFNPVTQSKKFDPQGIYLRRWLPELRSLPDRWIHEPWATPSAVQQACDFKPGRDYPLPCIDLAETRSQALEAYQSLRRKKKTAKQAGE